MTILVVKVPMATKASTQIKWAEGTWAHKEAEWKIWAMVEDKVEEPGAAILTLIRTSLTVVASR